MIALDIVIPIYNSEATIGNLLQQILEIQSVEGYQIGIILVNDGSTDSSLKVCNDFAERSEKVVVIDLMKNFGQHAAIFAGVSESKADLIVTMDDDGQHLIATIPMLLAALTNEHDVIYGVAEEDEHNFLRNFASNFFKSVVFRTLGIKDSRHISAFRLVRREVFNGIDFSHISSGILDVAINWNTSRILWIRVPMQKRVTGKSNYTLYKLCKFALNMLTSYSIRPLRIATVVGFVGFIVSASISTYMVIRSWRGDIEVPGFATLAVLVSTLGSVQLITLGILGEYLGNIHQKSIGKPVYSIRRITNQN